MRLPHAVLGRSVIEISSHCHPKLPYTQENRDSSDGLYALRDDAEVAQLRDDYGADLVILAGDFPDVCGRG